jgi:DNA-binding MarR family transcriptional regulator
MQQTNPDQIAAVRRFNRFYTRHVGALNEGLLKSPYSLTQMRVLYELAHAAPQTSQALCASLGLDPGYLSRILAQFDAEGLVARHRDRHDGRRLLITLTEHGRTTFAPYDRASAEEVGDVLARIDGPGRQRLVEAMATVEQLLSGKPAADAVAPPEGETAAASGATAAAGVPEAKPGAELRAPRAG